MGTNTAKPDEPSSSPGTTPRHPWHSLRKSEICMHRSWKPLFIGHAPTNRRQKCHTSNHFSACGINKFISKLLHTFWIGIIWHRHSLYSEFQSNLNYWEKKILKFPGPNKKTALVFFSLLPIKIFHSFRQHLKANAPEILQSCIEL